MSDTVIAIDLTSKTKRQSYDLPPCNRLWLPKKVLQADGLVSNPLDAVVGIQIDDKSGAPQPWAIQDGCITSKSGAMRRIYVTVITPGASPTLYLCTGTDLGYGYGDVDGLSAQVGGGAGDRGDRIATAPVARRGGLESL